jgi:hypothetical protein
VRLLVILAAGAFLTGCAGSAFDRDFRSKVQSNTLSLQGTVNGDTNSAGGEIVDTVVFRDPTKNGLSK